MDVHSQQASEGAPPPEMRVGDLIVNTERRSVMRETEPLDVTDRSFRLLEALIRQAPNEVSKDHLIEAVWPDEVVSDETLAQRVRLLRQALGDDSQDPRYIASVRGRGYRLVASVRAAEAGAATPGTGWIRFVAAAALLVAAAIAWQLADGPGPAGDVRPAGVLAVLPFTDLSEDGDHQFFADGMQEELLSQLAVIDGLSVVSRTTVERFRGSDLSLPSIAGEVGADAVVEGSVRVDGDRLRVTVQLIDAASDAHLWAGNFDRRLSMQAIFDLQAEVAGRVADALRLEFARAADEGSPLPTNDLDAYNLYLLGRYHALTQTARDLERAVGYLEQATAIDAEFAEAWAMLGWAYSFLGTGYGAGMPADFYPKAKEAALRAMALDADLSDARTLYADILAWYDWDFAAAEREYRKGLELNPLDVLGYALLLSTQERHDEAIALIERRLAIHPNDPWVRINAGWRYRDAGQIDRAIDAALAADVHGDSCYLLGLSRLAKHDAAAAVEIFETAIESEGRSPRYLAGLARAYFRAGRRADGERLLGGLMSLADDNALSPAPLAAVHFSAGDADAGFALLEQAFEERRRELIFLKVDRYLDGYRDDPRYWSLLERVGLQ